MKIPLLEKHLEQQFFTDFRIHPNPLDLQDDLAASSPRRGCITLIPSIIEKGFG